MSSYSPTPESFAGSPWLRAPMGSGRTLPSNGVDAPTKQALRLGIGLALVWSLSFVLGFKVTLSILSFAGFALAVIGLRRPMLGILGIGIICSLDTLMRVYLMKGGLLRYNTFNYWLLLVILVSLPVVLKQKDLQTRLLQIFSVLLFIELAMSPALTEGILHLLNLVPVFGLMVYFYRCRGYPHVWYMLGITIGLFSAMTGFAFFLNTDGLSFSSVDERAYSDPDYFDPNYIDPNGLGYVFLTGIFSLCTALASIRKSSNQKVTPILVLLVINLGWVVLVGSRGSMLVASMCAIYSLIVLRSNTRRFKLLAVLLLGAIFVMNWFPELLDRSVHRVDKLMDSKYTAAERTSARSDLAIGAWRLFVDEPFGVGTGGYKKSWAQLEDIRGLHSHQVRAEKAAHSAWLKTLAENGVPGITIFALFVFSFGYTGLVQMQQGDFPFGLLISVALSTAFVSTEFPAKGIWFIVAAATAYLNHRHPISDRLRPQQGQGSHSPIAPSSALSTAP